MYQTTSTATIRLLKGFSGVAISRNQMQFHNPSEKKEPAIEEQHYAIPNES